MEHGAVPLITDGEDDTSTRSSWSRILSMLARVSAARAGGLALSLPTGRASPSTMCEWHNVWMVQCVNIPTQKYYKNADGCATAKMHHILLDSIVVSLVCDCVHSTINGEGRNARLPVVECTFYTCIQGFTEYLRESLTIAACHNKYL